VYTWNQWEAAKKESGEAVANEELRIAGIGGKIKIFYIKLQIRKNQFIFYKLPDNSCHLISV
jgi:hypothetical protein